MPTPRPDAATIRRTVQHTEVTGPGGRRLRAALALPDDDVPRPVPGVIVVHEMFGLNDDIRGIAARFAANGYAAIAPDLLSGGAKPVCLARLVRDIARYEGDVPTLDLLDAVRARLAEQPGVDGERTAVIGFCMGGSFALAYGLRGTVRASSTNYGHVPKDGTAASAAVARSCPVVGSYGADDKALPGAAGRLDRLLTELGVPHDVKAYPGAGHSFMNDGAPAWIGATMGRLMGPAGYQHEAAEDAWARILAFFDEHVRGAGQATTG